MHISGIQVIRILRNASGMRDCRTKFRLWKKNSGLEIAL
jgi:hypothetical protein